MDFVILRLYLVGIRFIFRFINFIVIIRNMWFVGGYILVFFFWLIKVILFLLFIMLFVLVGGFIMFFIDWYFNILFFDFVGGGDLVLF